MSGYSSTAVARSHRSEMSNAVQCDRLRTTCMSFFGRKAGMRRRALVRIVVMLQGLELPKRIGYARRIVRDRTAM